MSKRFFRKVNFIKNVSIQSKIIISFSLLIVVTLMVIGIVAVSKYSSTMEKNTGEYTYQIIDQVIKNIHYYVKEMESILQTFLKIL
jgi:two-component system sensor histidine kinase YesM